VDGCAHELLAGRRWAVPGCAGGPGVRGWLPWPLPPGRSSEEGRSAGAPEAPKPPRDLVVADLRQIGGLLGPQSVSRRLRVRTRGGLGVIFAHNLTQVGEAVISWRIWGPPPRVGTAWRHPESGAKCMASVGFTNPGSSQLPGFPAADPFRGSTVADRLRISLWRAGQRGFRNPGLTPRRAWSELAIPRRLDPSGWGASAERACNSSTAGPAGLGGGRGERSREATKWCW
jgi:hypothetical protein